MASTSYNGGAGGKFRKRPFPKPQTTPYDRPPTAIRPTQIINNNNNNNNNGWLSKIVNPASEFITARAHKFFSSVRKRILPAPSPPPQPLPLPSTQQPEDEGKEIEYMQPETTTNVLTSDRKVVVDFGGNASSMPSDSYGVSELEDILKQKTFTRSQIDHLTALLLSRNIENSDGTAEGSSHQKLSDLQAVLTRHDNLSDPPAHENRIEHSQSAVISTPELRSKALQEDVASPAEIAKAYMGRRPTKVSPSVLRLHNQFPREDLSTPSNPLLKSSSPVMSLNQKPVSVIGTSTNGFMTPRFRGRSAIYSMARTPYSRVQPVTTFKAVETNFNTGGGSSNLNATLNDPTKKQVLKRRSSVLENDIGSVGPIRRIRQKPNLLHPKTLSLPPPRGRQTAHVSGVVSDVAELPSKEQSSQNRSFSKLIAENNLSDTSQYVPSQSIEMAQKIFDQLDKFSPKGSVGKNVDIFVGTSSAKTPGMENLDSLKPLQNSQHTKKFVGSLDSVHGPNLQPQTSSLVEEVSARKYVISSAIISPQDDAKGKKVGSCLSSKGKATEYMTSAVDSPKKRSFRMSAQEDFLELDDDLPSNNPFAEERQNAESPRTSVAIPDALPRDQPIVREKPSATKTTAELGKNELESLANGSSASGTIAGFPSVVLSSSPATNMTLPAAFSPPQSTPKSDKTASQHESSDIFTPSGTKADNLPPFVFTPAAKDTKLEAPISAKRAAAEVNGPDIFGNKSTPAFGNTVVGAPSNGTHTNDVTSINGVLCQSPAKADASGQVPFSSSSNNQTSVSISASSSLPSSGFKFSNGGVQSTFTPSTSTPGISSTGHPSGPETAPSISFASVFPSASTTLPTSASDITDKSNAKSDATGFGNASGSLLDAKPAAFSFQSGSTPVSGFAPSSQSASSVSAPISTFVPSFTGQSACSVSALASTSVPSFPGQSASVPTPTSTSTSTIPVQAASSVPSSASTSALSFPGHSAASPSAFVFGSSGTTGSSTGSIFGSFSANPFSSGSSTASSTLGSSLTSSSISTSSSTTSGIFGFTSQSPKPTSTFTFGSSGAATSSLSFGAPSSSSSFGATTGNSVFGAPTSSSAFGAPTSTPAFGNTTSTSVFGATTNSSTASNTAPFVFGGTSGVAASSPAMTNSAFQSPPAFAFGSTPSANNGQMTMEDTMAEDSSQPSTPPSVFGATPTFGAPPTFGATPAFGAQPSFGAPISAPSGGFAFNATPAPVSPFQFNTQPSPTAPQNPPFQPSGSLEFNGGATGTNSFSLGTNDKSQRRIVRVKKTGRRK